MLEQPLNTHTHTLSLISETESAAEQADVTHSNTPALPHFYGYMLSADAETGNQLDEASRGHHMCQMIQVKKKKWISAVAAAHVTLHEELISVKCALSCNSIIKLI